MKSLPLTNTANPRFMHPTFARGFPPANSLRAYFENASFIGKPLKRTCDPESPSLSRSSSTTLIAADVSAGKPRVLISALPVALKRFPAYMESPTRKQIAGMKTSVPAVTVFIQRELTLVVFPCGSDK